MKWGGSATIDMAEPHRPIKMGLGFFPTPTPTS